MAGNIKESTWKIGDKVMGVDLGVRDCPYPFAGTIEEIEIKDCKTKYRIKGILPDFDCLVDEFTLVAFEKTRWYKGLELFSQHKLLLDKANKKITMMLKLLRDEKDIDITKDNLELQDTIYEKLKELLEQNYKNAFVAITFDGKIIASDFDNVGLLEKLKDINYPSSQIFIRKVGAASVAGWE